MKRLLHFAAIMAFAYAIQDRSPALAQAVYTLTVTEPQLNLIGSVLGKRPYEEVAAVIATIQQQVNQQQAKAAQAGKPEPPKEEK